MQHSRPCPKQPRQHKGACGPTPTAGRALRSARPPAHLPFPPVPAILCVLLPTPLPARPPPWQHCRMRGRPIGERGAAAPPLITIGSGAPSPTPRMACYAMQHGPHRQHHRPLAPAARCAQRQATYPLNAIKPSSRPDRYVIIISIINRSKRELARVRDGHLLGGLARRAAHSLDLVDHVHALNNWGVWQAAWAVQARAGGRRFVSPS